MKKIENLEIIYILESLFCDENMKVVPECTIYYLHNNILKYFKIEMNPDILANSEYLSVSEYITENENLYIDLLLESDFRVDNENLLYMKDEYMKKDLNNILRKQKIKEILL